MKDLNLSQIKLLSELEIPIELYFGDILMSAEQLIDLRGGEQIPVTLHENSKVSLVVSGEVIAVGKLLSENENIFVEITEIIGEQLPPEHLIATQSETEGNRSGNWSIGDREK